MGEDKPPGRCTAKERAALVLRILGGELSVEEAARDCGLKVLLVRQWKNRFLRGATRALGAPPKPTGRAPVSSSATVTTGPSLPRRGRFYPEADFTIEERANAVAELLLQGLNRVAAGKARDKARRWRDKQNQERGLSEDSKAAKVPRNKQGKSKSPTDDK